MKNTVDRTGGKPIAVISAFNPLVALYDVYRGKVEVLFFCSVPNKRLKIIELSNFGKSIPYEPLLLAWG
jgi:hypothetical protein